MALSYGGSRRRGSSSVWRRWVATALVGALASTAPTGPVPAGATAKPVGADSVSVSALRKGMTWTVLGQQGDYVHVGRDGQTDAYAGDTTVDQYLSALCLLVDARPAPAIPFDHDNGWARGAVKVTAPIRGDALTSRAQGDSICASTFGTGWRLAEFHDGRWGTDFVFSGGWSFWAAGVLTPGTRFWTAISDQPANPWNSVGDLPPPIVTPDDDLVLKTRLQENMQPLLRFAQVSEFHSLVNNAVARRFDGDDNVLLSSLISEAEATGIVNPTAADWVAFKNSVASFANINGTAYHPQIYIPNFQDGAVPGSSVTMVVFESDLARTALPAYDLDANGRLRLKSTLVDEAYTESNEVWVLSINERVDLGAEELAAIREMDESGATANTASVPYPAAPVPSSPGAPTQPLPGWPTATQPAVSAPPTGRPPGPMPPSSGYRPPFAPHGPFAPHRPHPPGAAPQVKAPKPAKPPKPPRERSSLGAATFSLIFVALGAVAILHLSNVISVSASAYFAAALATIGLGLLVGAWFGRARWLIALGLVAAAALGTVTLVESYTRVRNFDGNVTWTPTSHELMAQRYENNFGDAVLDLTQVSFTDRETRVTAVVTFGNLTVIVPPNVDVTAIAEIKAGDAGIFGTRWSGVNGPSRQVTDLGADGAGGGKLRLNLHVNAGNLEVIR